MQNYFKLWLIAVITVPVTLGEIKVKINKNGTKRPTVKIFRAMTEATFGPRIPAEGIAGYLTLAAPEESACKELYSPPDYIDNWSMNWIALIASGNCSFQSKVQNAQNAKFNAVIVYGTASDDLVVMHADHPKVIKIPAVFVGRTTGKELERKYITDESDDFYIILRSNEAETRTVTESVKSNTNKSSRESLMPWIIVVPLLALLVIALIIIVIIFKKNYDVLVLKI